MVKSPRKRPSPAPTIVDATGAVAHRTAGASPAREDPRLASRTMSRMTDRQGRLRLTVLGNSTAVPHPESAAAGYLVEWGETSVLLDAGQGVIRSLQDRLDPHSLSAVVIGHMHADH